MQRIPGKHYVCSFSGGKDSTLMLYELLRLKWPLDEIRFLDCGLEFPINYEWLDYLEKRLGITIKRYRTTLSFDELFYKKRIKGKYIGKIRGFPAASKGCWVSSEMKLAHKPNALNEIVYIGISASESHRAKPADNKYYPLVEWGLTEEDIRKKLEELDLVPFYYKLGFKRNGCWLCPKQPTSSLKLLWKLYPDLWAKLKKYEQDSPWGFRDTTKTGRHLPIHELERRWKLEESGVKIKWYGLKKSLMVHSPPTKNDAEPVAVDKG